VTSFHTNFLLVVCAVQILDRPFEQSEKLPVISMEVFGEFARSLISARPDAMWEANEAPVLGCSLASWPSFRTTSRHAASVRSGELI